MTDKELRTLDEMLTNLEIWSTWNKTFANEMIGICSKMRNLLANRKAESSSEKPNNCEHITEDGVTCAKYPACDDCPDNPLNKVKGSERLVKGSEQTEPAISKMEQVDKDINVRSKDELMTKGVWNAGYKTGYDKGYKDAQKVKDSQDLVKELVKTFCEDGTWLERQGVYTLTLAEAKQRAVDIIESVLAKDEPTTQTETQNSNLTFEKRTMRDCYNCKRYETEGECIECHYEPKTEPQTMIYPQVDGITPSVIITEDRDTQILDAWQVRHRNTTSAIEDEPQTDCAWK